MTPAATLFQSIAESLDTKANQLGGTIADKIRDDLSIPVQYVIGPRGGVRVIRSKRGEHPRRETGNLQSQVDHRVERVDTKVTLSIFDPVGYAEPLDNPDALNRPITNGIIEEFEDAFIDIMISAIGTE